MAYLLHRIWQRTGRFPSEIRALPYGERSFLMASEHIQLEHENEHPLLDVPAFVKVLSGMFGKK